MAASGSGGEPGRPWTATSTWAPAGAATVEDAVSFETSTDDAESSPTAVVLARPPSDGGEDPPPCEVTVNFTGKYEIHRVYVKSTARIYEIYYSPDLKDTSKDYLCTVRCGLAANEPLPSGEECMSQGSSNTVSVEKHEQETKSVTSSSDEDSWVEVKVPESPLESNTPESQERNAIGTHQKNTLAHYEATAEITDASPCVSLTVRLLSLESKTSVHLEEIYIFADNVGSTSDESVAGPGNMGGSSLLAMLVPGLMQMSKSTKCKIDDSYFPDGLRTQLPEGCALKESSPCGKIDLEAAMCGTNDSSFMSAGLENRIPPMGGDTISNEKSNQGEFPLNVPRPLPLPERTTENIQVASAKGQRVSNMDQDTGPVMNGNFTPHNPIEKTLEILLSKVEKVELYCSRFEDSMMRPLGSIEARLKRLEQQFDSFSVEIQSLSARMSVPNVYSDITNSQEKEHYSGNTGTSASIMNRQPGLVIRAPEFSLEDSCGCDLADENTIRGPNVRASDFICEPEVTCEKLHHGPFPPADSASSSEKERKSTPGLAVKVPEFPNDEDDEVEDVKETAGDLDDRHTNSDDTLSKSTVNDPKGKAPVTIDGALAFALEAFLNSTKATSPSKSVACTASNLSAENTIDSSSSSLSNGQADEISTKDGSVGQFHGEFGDVSKEVDVVPPTSVSKARLVGNVEVNELNIDLYPDKTAFASTEPWSVPSWPHTGSVDDRTQVNEKNYDPTLDTMTFVMSNEPVDDPSQPPPTLLGSVADGTQMKEKSSTIWESVDKTAQVNESRPVVSLAEFLAARNASSFRNGPSEVCLGNDGAAISSFKRTSPGAHKNLEDADRKVGQKNPMFQLLLVKKALEIDEGDGNISGDLSINTTFESSNCASPANGATGDGVNAMETLSDKDGDLEITENNIRLSGGMDSVFFEFPDSKKTWIDNSSLDSGPVETLMKPEVERSWLDLSSIESLGVVFATEAISSRNTATGNYFEDLFAGNGASYNVTPTAGPQLQRVYDLLHECENDILGMPFVAERTNNSSPSLEVLLGESSDSEAQISDLEDIDNEAAPFGSDNLFSTFSSSDEEAFAMDGPLVDVVDAPLPSEVYASAANEPLVDVVDRTDPSETYAPSVNEPYSDVPDLPEPSNIDASAVDKPLSSVDDLPETSETFAGGSSGEHHDSLI